MGSKMWSGLGKGIADIAPSVGAALGGPGGAAVGAILSSALGVSNNPRDIATLLSTDSAAKAKLAELELSLAQHETDQLRDINETMRVEYSADSWFKSGWRPFIGWMLGSSFASLSVALIYAIIKNPTVVSDPEFTGLLVWLFAAMGAVVGVNIRERTKSKK